MFSGYLFFNSVKSANSTAMKFLGYSGFDKSDSMSDQLKTISAIIYLFLFIIFDIDLPAIYEMGLFC